MNTIHHKKIAIVGGGPGGLTLARLLQQKGIDVKVYERDIHKDVRVQGATLDLHEESGLAALAEAGLMDAFKSVYRPGADLTRITDAHGNILLDEHIHADRESSRPEIDRGPLRKLLLESLAPETVVWDSQFVSMSREKEGWILTFRNGLHAYADIVIAADGANSRLRPYLTSIKPFFAGVSSVEGIIYEAEKNTPRIYHLLNGGKLFVLSGEKSLILSSKGDGSLVFYTGVKTDEDWVRDGGIDFTSKKSVLQWFKQTYSDYGPIWDEMFEQATPPFIPRATHCMPLDQHWPSQSNLTMLGDAAHLMPQYAGEGVNMAMLDALELSRCLLNDDYPDTDKAIEAYEETMRIRAAEYGKMSLDNTEILHSAAAQAYMIDLLGDPGQA